MKRLQDIRRCSERAFFKAARSGSKCPLLYVIPEDWIAVEHCNQTEMTQVEAEGEFISNSAILAKLIKTF